MSPAPALSPGDGPAAVLSATLLIAWLLASPFFQLALGRRALAAIGAGPGDAAQARDLAAATVLGLLLHLVGIFALVLVGLPWLVATFLPLLPALFPWRGLRAFFPGGVSVPGPGFALWFAVVFALGLSLFQVPGGIETPWKNNYGDLAFHVGMIASFVFGANFPPEYPVYAGERLSYPFFVNLWTASSWWIHPGFQALRGIFVFQWVALWCAVYLLLDGRRLPLLPWALLLGGGSYLALGHGSGELIESGVPWTSFLTTVWVTQRTALLGVCASLAALVLFHSQRDADGRRGAAAAGLVLGLSPLAHAHICGVTALCIGLVLLLRRDLRGLLSFALFLCPALLALPWLVGKAGTLGWMAGWITGEVEGVRPLASLRMWILHAGPWLALVGVLWATTRRHAWFVALAVLFLAGNVVRLVVWDWDQLKFFLGLYVVFLFLWSVTTGGRALLAQALCLVLVIPGAVDAWAALRRGSQRVVYTPAQLEAARIVRERTDPHAVIAAAPLHNSTVTLTGRRLFLGYQGTLWSHGIDAAARSALVENLEQLARCAAECPDYLLWTEQERRYWYRPEPGPGWEPSGIPNLYRRAPDP